MLCIYFYLSYKRYLLILIIKKCLVAQKKLKYTFKGKSKEESAKGLQWNMTWISIWEKLLDLRMILMEFRINYQKQR